jgi:hypothetical protein
MPRPMDKLLISLSHPTASRRPDYLKQGCNEPKEHVSDFILLCSTHAPQLNVKMHS